MVLNMEYYYRYDATDSFDLTLDNTKVAELFRFTVLSHTPCGVWISLLSIGGKKFILNNSRKAFAYPTKEKALESYYARKRKYVAILTARLEEAKLQLEAKPVDYHKKYYEDKETDIASS